LSLLYNVTCDRKLTTTIKKKKKNNNNKTIKLYNISNTLIFNIKKILLILLKQLMFCYIRDDFIYIFSCKCNLLFYAT